MRRIGLISDTHSWLDEQVFTYFDEVDEIWHAGDVGDIAVLDALKKVKPVRGVYGNIDNHEVRAELPRDRRFLIEGFDVWMTHIGGYPGRYSKRVREALKHNPPHIFICGHSHILKVMRDKKYKNMFCLNPGAAGVHGFHKVRTLLRFTLDKGNIKDMEVIELGLRGKSQPS
ncbi:MAG: metallophosphoesterase family protein [Chitinophagales bacterium]